MDPTLAVVEAGDGLTGGHVLVLLPFSTILPGEFPARDALLAVLSSKEMKPGDLSRTPVSVDAGALYCFVMPDPSSPVFSIHSLMREALEPLLAEHPETIDIFVASGTRPDLAERALYCAWVNGMPLPVFRKKGEDKPLSGIRLHGAQPACGTAARAAGNNLCRMLTSLPGNALDPAAYRKRIRDLAASHGWEIAEYDYETLKQMGAGAFCAVAQGSPARDAAIVHLVYRGSASKKVALVGKGICFDTGGHNLKSARGMQGMHEDMNGSAVALGILLSATLSGLEVCIECYLAIAENHMSPAAYRQNDIVTALDGTTIEIVHTDAEGRMVLADALVLAARAAPDLIVDFSTLTGSMATALGSRYSGILGNRQPLVDLAVLSGKLCGERLCAFPFDEDYDKDLESDVADIRQCTMEGEADHILAARFLSRFVDDRPWLHIDLSASKHKGGLGAVGTDITGFGVSWGMEFLQEWLRKW
ncbi:MAG: leucyl aminopeptidase family protein [Burkholderiales bacterium]|nr:leucyl aminopeptidase family protein [Burkholderiales bacterium]